MILIWIHERGIYTKMAILSRKITINYWILECLFFDKPQLGISWKLKSCTFPVSVHVPPNLRKEVKGAIHLLKFWGCPQKMQLQPMWPHQFWQPSVLSASRAAAKGGHQPTKSCCFAAAFLFELFLWTLMNSAIVFQYISMTLLIFLGLWNLAVCQNLVPLVNIKIAGIYGCSSH